MSDLTLTIKLTDAGLAAVAAAHGQGLQAKITHVAVGDQGYAPAATATALHHELARVALTAGGKVGPTQILLQGMIPAGGSQFFIRELGYFLEDGTLLGVWSDPVTPLGWIGGATPWFFKLAFAWSSLPADAITVIIADDAGQAGMALDLSQLEGKVRHTVEVGGALTWADGDDTLLTAAVNAMITAAVAPKAPLASPALTGAPTAPTAPAGTNNNQLSTTAFVQNAVAALVASSPAALDTLKELATALGNDPNFATTITNALAAKAPLVSPPLTGIPTAPTAAVGTNNTQIATTAFVYNAAPDALPARIKAASEIIADWNTATKSGWYGSNAATVNGPVANAYGVGRVDAYNADWIVQTVRLFFVASAADTATYQRQYSTSANGWGAWYRIRQSEAEIATSAAPAGKIDFFARATAPAGWLKANGAAVAVANYPALDAAIYCGDANNATADWCYRCNDPLSPSTSRSTTGAYIVLPDVRGEQVRGWDDGRGIDPGRSLWSRQAESINTGGIALRTASVTWAATAAGVGVGIVYRSASDSGSYGNSYTFGGGTETRPRNVAMLVCIKY